MNPKLEKLLEDRKKKLNVIAPNIADIHNRTVRVKKNQIAGEKEFYTNRGKYLMKGDLYHIHYTNDLQAYYMTGAEHNSTTQMIFRSDVQSDSFDYYNGLNKQRALKIESNVTVPTEDDYKSGRLKRYFAKKTNEKSSPVFEISEDDFETSPLYDYVSLVWYLKGNKRRVFNLNRREILIASRTIPNISKLLPDYQYYRSSKILTAKEEVQSRLGMTSEQDQSEEPTQTTTTSKTNTQDSTPYYTGAPPGVTSGGAGGGSY
mgnify:CR=1 FL=1